MSEISHSKLASFLKDERAVRSLPIFLIYGEEYLYKKVLQKILAKLLSGKERDHSCITMEGGPEALSNALAELNTFSFFSEGKVVIINDARIFEGQETKELLVEKIETALAEDDLKKGARTFLSYLTRCGHKIDDLDLDSEDKSIRALLAPFADQQAVKKIIGYCRQKKVKAATSFNQSEFLEQAVLKGFPQRHHLILTMDSADRRRKLFKTLKEKGLVVDCSVPKGERKADKQAQEVVLRQTLDTVLNTYNKAMAPGAYRKLCDMTGFDLPTFSQNLEKLVNFVGEKPVIDEGDVAKVVDRSRQDPIYAFTNALTSRNAGEALFFLDSLFQQKAHPLQVLAAMTNQFRKLIIAKDFVLGKEGKVWVKGCSYGRFTASVLPAIKSFDQQMTDFLKSWSEELNQKAAGNGSNVRKKQKKGLNSVSSDLRIANNSNSPYPIYQLMLRTDLFSREKISAVLEKLSQADYRLKTSPSSPRLVLEDVVIFICN